MADKKISQLTALAASGVAPSTDVMAVVDTNVTETKKITVKDVVDGALNTQTANGVVYLNASKEATAGSALTYDGTTFKADAAAVFNDSGADVDFRVESDTVENALFVDGATGNVGIGTSSPGRLLELSSSAPVIKMTDTTGSDYTEISYNAAAFNINVDVGNSIASSSFRVLVDNSEAMRITSAGNVGIGTSTPANLLHISADNFSSITPLKLSNSINTDGEYIGLEFEGSARNRTCYIRANHDSTTTQSLSFGTDNSGTPTERMRIDSAGELLVGGTTSLYGSSGKLTVQGAAGGVLSLFRNDTSVVSPNNLGQINFWGNDTTSNTPTILAFINGVASGTHSAGDNPTDLVFGTTADGSETVSEKMRLTDAGELLVGKTSDSNTAVGIALRPNGQARFVSAGSASDLTLAFFRNGSASEVGSIATTSTATTYNTSSDRRLKENIAPADDAGAVIDAIEIVKHDWKAGGHTRYSAIAQDLHAVAPEAVTVGDDGEEVENTWGVDYSKLVPMLVKEIQSLRTRVAALEGAN